MSNINVQSICSHIRKKCLKIEKSSVKMKSCFAMKTLLSVPKPAFEDDKKLEDDDASKEENNQKLLHKLVPSSQTLRDSRKMDHGVAGRCEYLEDDELLTNYCSAVKKRLR